MDKITFLKLCLKMKSYEKRNWILASFGLPVEQTRKRDLYEPHVVDGKWVYLDDTGLVTLNEEVKDEPLFDPDKTMTLVQGDLVNVTDTVKTTIGNVMFNAIVFVFPFGDRVPFYNKKVTGKYLDELIAGLLKSKVITAKERTGKFTVAMGYLTVFTQLLVPAATPKSLRAPEGIEKLRDDFLRENADRMHTETAAAELDAILTKALREHLKGDPSLKHLLSSKSFATVRKMMYGSIGSAKALDDLNKVMYTGKSLKEGWGPEDMYEIANNLRTGSSLRGTETQQGGYTAKKLTRAYQNTKIIEDDCKSDIGMRLKITKANYELYVGRYLVGVKDPLDKAKLSSLIGKEVIMRDPNACKTTPPSFCVTCFGDGVGKSDVGLGSQMAGLGGQFLAIKLSLFHVNELKLEEFKPADRFF